MKMQSWVLAAVIVCVCGPTVSALAANSDNGPGCGLGKLAWNDYKHQKNIAPQVMMATTNATFGSQTFGISSGTSGCTNDGTIMAQSKTSLFAALNFENLSQEIAQGRGEHLVSLATLMGVPAAQHDELFALAQARYTAMVQAGATEPSALLTALQVAMAQHPVLVQLTVGR
jgi:hypothetical protein